MGLMKDGFVKGLSSCMKLQRMNCQGRGAETGTTESRDQEQEKQCISLLLSNQQEHTGKQKVAGYFT